MDIHTDVEQHNEQFHADLRPQGTAAPLRAADVSTIDDFSDEEGVLAIKSEFF